jgi:hypothetical protein
MKKGLNQTTDLLKLQFSKLKLAIHLQTFFYRFKISNFYIKITIDTSNNCYAKRLCEVGGLA